MATSVRTQAASRFNSLKWLMVGLLVIGSIVANFYYADVAWAIRAAVGIVVLCATLLLASSTDKGQVAWAFLKAAGIEMQKVVWPTRSETIQTAIMVVVMVLIAAVIMWGFDTLFMWLISQMAGARG